ncbi:MAG: NADH:ubiquinone reductase (Na(+)-transporting) subunit A, partial [Bacteroidota bacterium]
MAVIAGLVLLGVLLQLVDNLLRIEAKQAGADRSGANYSLFPSMGEIIKPKMPEYVGGEPVTVFKKGHDILLQGEASADTHQDAQVTTFAVQPRNFVGMSPIPKLSIAVGDEVKAGDQLFFDKTRPDVKYVAPVSGEVIAINRAEKRSIAEVVILADKEIKYRELEPFDLENGSREDLVNYLMDVGAWPFVRQRPFDTVADPKEPAKAIFISTFDTAPLAPDLNLAVEGRAVEFQKGLDVLNKLVDGPVHLGLNAKSEEKPSDVFLNAEGVEKHWFHGKHPAGNVGIQIHHTDPIGMRDRVWTV